MKAVSCVHGTLSVIEMPAPPKPADGQLVVNVASCGICGSDLHAKDHADEVRSNADEMGYRDFMRSDTPRGDGSRVLRGGGRRARPQDPKGFRSAPEWCPSRWCAVTVVCT